MRILVVTPRVPYPPLRGDQVVAFHHLRVLGARHALTLVTLYGQGDDRSGLAVLERYCERTVAVPFSRVRSVARVTLNAATPLPLQVLLYRSPALRRAVSEVFATGNFDVVHGYLTRVAPAISGLQAPRVLDLIDSLTLLYARQAQRERIPLRWAYREELRRIAAYEKEAVQRFDRVIVVSERDRAALPPGPISVVPNGVDTDVFKPTPEMRSAVQLVIFAGNMGYMPNIDAARWFADEIFPRVRAYRPDVQLAIVGARPARAIRKLGTRPGIHVTGRVDSMPDTLNRATVAVAPVRSASGMQNKVLEAMACGLPTVTTSPGLGSIRAEPGRDVLVADDPDAFAAALGSLLESRARREQLGQQARECVIHEHSWERACDAVEAIWGEVASR